MPPTYTVRHGSLFDPSTPSSSTQDSNLETARTTWKGSLKSLRDSAAAYTSPSGGDSKQMKRSVRELLESLKTCARRFKEASEIMRMSDAVFTAEIAKGLVDHSKGLWRGFSELAPHEVSAVAGEGEGENGSRTTGGDSQRVDVCQVINALLQSIKPDLTSSLTVEDEVNEAAAGNAEEAMDGPLTLSPVSTNTIPATVQHMLDTAEELGTLYETCLMKVHLAMRNVRAAYRAGDGSVRLVESMTTASGEA